MERKYEIRCPIHGFIELNEWERDIINQLRSSVYGASASWG